MTPTLYGRWQTRLLLLGSLGLVVTFFFGWGYGDFVSPYALIGYVAAFGLLWDWLYIFLQKFRWNRDWPPAFQVGEGLVEGTFIWLLTRIVSLPGVSPDLSLVQFLAHYATVWLVVFLATQSLLRILFPFWRFYGGEWLTSIDAYDS